MATKDVEPVGEEGIKLKEASEENYLHLVPQALGGVEVDIALLGQIRSGRPSFVNAITG